MFISKTFFLVLSTALAVNAVPSNIETRGTDAAAAITLCSSTNLSGDCMTVPINSGTCAILPSTLFLKLSSASIPSGSICTFFL
ncbi:hypothetical protein M422DRAFT_248256 [Sphaerobolus stellatus SS14]|uniref:Hydrophobin n=1 Tax=Sphaerobolus stellatus (strain SS14) TaxID=990650 RepID=A0A0C9W502_SPHS4|nr:hypothetical protein M422DRAFT_248256 [Sphaerobolus stellatus SS14]